MATSPSAFHTEYVTTWCERTRIFWELYHRLRDKHKDEFFTGEEVTAQVNFTLQILPSLIYTDFLPNGGRLSRSESAFERQVKEAMYEYAEVAGDYCAEWDTTGRTASLAVIEKWWKAWGTMLQDAVRGKPL